MVVVGGLVVVVVVEVVGFLVVVVDVVGVSFPGVPSGFLVVVVVTRCSVIVLAVVPPDETHSVCSGFWQPVAARAAQRAAAQRNMIFLSMQNTPLFLRLLSVGMVVSSAAYRV